MANHEQDGIGDEDELFSEMLSGDAPKFDAEPDDVGSDPAASEPDKATRERDEFGRFKAKGSDTQDQPVEAEPPKQETPVEAAAQDPAPAQQPPAREDDDGKIPSWRMREIREARDAERARAEKAEADARQAVFAAQQMQNALAAMQQQLQALQNPKPQQPSIPDMFEDPVGYNAYRERQYAELQQQMREQIQKEARSIRLHMNLAHNAQIHGREFSDAVNSFTSAAEEEKQLGLDTLQRLIFGPTNAPYQDPGERILRWYRNGEVMRKTGGDLAAYEQQLADRLLSDPAHLAKAMERARAQAGGAPVAQPAPLQPAARPNTTVQLPPSLRSVPGTSGSAESGIEMLSDEELFNAAARR